MAPKIDNRRGISTTPEQRYRRAQLEAANDMWGHFKRLAAEKADTDAEYENRMGGTEKDVKFLQGELQAVRKDRDALLSYADLLESLLRRVLSSRTWRIMEPVRIVGRWLRAIISRRKSAKEPLPTRPELSTETQDRVRPMTISRDKMNSGRDREQSYTNTISHTMPMHFGNPVERDLAAYCLASLKALREEYVTKCDRGPLRETIECVFRNARLALERRPEAVVDKTRLSPSGDPHDYYHPDPYWWPHHENKDRLPYVKQHGRRIRGTVLYEPGSGRYDRTRLQRLFDDGISLALASMITYEDRYVEHAGACLRRWFLEPESRMNPHLRYARVRLGHNGNEGFARGIIETKDLYYYLDAVRMIEKFGVLTASESRDFRNWLAEYLTWLQKSARGLAACDFSNHHGIYYDLQVASIASFLNDDESLFRAIVRAKERMPGHFSQNGVPYEQLARTQTAHHCYINLQGWLNLTILARRYGEDLVHHTAPNGASLQAAINWLSCHFAQPWPYAGSDDFDADRVIPLVHVARALGFTVNVPADYEETVARVTRERPVFRPCEGVRPYWNI